MKKKLDLNAMGLDQLSLIESTDVNGGEARDNAGYNDATFANIGAFFYGLYKGFRAGIK